MLKYEKIIRLAETALQCPELREVCDFHINRIINSEIYYSVINTGLTKGKIHAVKHYKEMYGGDLDTAKTRLEQYFVDNGLVFKGPE